jgi:hypothetical protein
MNNDTIGINAETILHEASTVLQAAQRYASELSDVGVTDDEFHLMSVLIAHVAVHCYTSLNNSQNITAEVRELKILKEVIYRTAEMRFGHTSNVLNEFKYSTQHPLSA